MDICDNNYSKALDKYYNAFEFNDSPFPRDIYHVVLLNIYLNNYKDALKFGSNLIKLGATIKFFNQYPLNNLKKDTLAWNEFLKNYKILRRNYYDKINFDLQNHVTKLNMMDQKNYCNRDPISGQIGQFFAQDSTFEECYEFIKKYGYPYHNLTGINIKNDTIIVASPINVIIKHYFQENYRDLDGFSALLLNEVYKGKLQPVYFMSWDEFRFEPYPHYGTMLMYKTKNGYYIENPEMNKQKIAMFNKNRKEIFMCSYEESIRKIIFMEKNKNLKFIFLKTGMIDLENDFPPYLKLKQYKKININDY